MPTELDDPTATPSPAATDPTPSLDGGGDSPASTEPPDPLTAGLEEGLEDAAALQKGDDAPAPTGTPATTPAVPPAPPTGLTVDKEGRWRTADGKFAEKQPSEAAAASAKAETAKLAQIEAYKKNGLDEHGNRPWTPNIYGKEKPILPGAIDRPGHGIFIPEAQRGTLTALVARGEKWHESVKSRQEQEAAITREQQRTAHFESSFVTILKSTVLNPEWMEWAAKDAGTYETAKMQVETRLEAASVAAAQQFGKIPEKPKDGAVPSTDPPDQYEAQQAFAEFLDEEFPGIDKRAVADALVRENVQLMANLPDHGWVIDTRPIRLAARYIQQQKQQSPGPAATPAVDPAKERNKAAVPTTAAPKPPAARPKATTAPEDPQNDPRYADKPWENPALDRETRRALFYSKNLKIRAPA